MSDAGTPQGPHGAARSIVERAARPVLTDLRDGYPATADVLARVLREGTLAAPLPPKPLSKLAAELLESLPAPDGTAPPAIDSSGGPDNHHADR